MSNTEVLRFELFTATALHTRFMKENHTRLRSLSYPFRMLQYLFWRMISYPHRQNSRNNHHFSTFNHDPQSTHFPHQAGRADRSKAEAEPWGDLRAEFSPWNFHPYRENTRWMWRSRVLTFKSFLNNPFPVHTKHPLNETMVFCREFPHSIGIIKRGV